MFGSPENRYRDAKIIFGEIRKYNYYIERIMSGKLLPFTVISNVVKNICMKYQSRSRLEMPTKDASNMRQ